MYIKYCKVKFYLSIICMRSEVKSNNLLFTCGEASRSMGHDRDSHPSWN